MRSTQRLRIVLVCPRIAANVGNVARTCSALGAELHLVGPLGFQIDLKRLDRASVGYWEELKPVVYLDFNEFWSQFPRLPETQFVFAEKDGSELYSELSYADDCVLIFGNEEEGVDPLFWKTESLPVIALVEFRCERYAV